ncbi:hypothetical protein ES708_08517 [subsurface metagenome]
MISGNFHADEGSIYLEGNRVRFDSPAESRKAGIETVYQNSEVCENASVAGNFFIGRELCGNVPGFRVLKERAMVRETEKVLSDIGIEVYSVKSKMGFLSGGQRQAIVLGRFFHWGGQSCSSGRAVCSARYSRVQKRAAAHQASEWAGPSDHIDHPQHRARVRGFKQICRAPARWGGGKRPNQGCHGRRCRVHDHGRNSCCNLIFFFNRNIIFSHF